MPKVQIYASEGFVELLEEYAIDKARKQYGDRPNISATVRELVIAGLEAKQAQQADER